MKDIVALAKETVIEAGAFLRDHAKRVDGVVQKADKSLATALDQKSEAMIRQMILDAFPSHAILGEEGGQEEDGDGYLWVVDPLDGTHNLINGIPLFAVSVGVLYQREFVVGAICLPLLGDVYVAEQGQGAFKNDVRISVSDKSDFGMCSLAFDSGFRNFEQPQFDVLHTLAPKAFNARVFGCSAGNLALLAEGSLDVIVEFDDYPWDNAAGVVIVREAGGRVTDVDGSEFAFEGRRYVASNGHVHDEVLDMISKADVMVEMGV